MRLSPLFSFKILRAAQQGEAAEKVAKLREQIEASQHR